MLVRTAECIEGHVEIELVCEPAFDYGRDTAEWTLVDGDRHAADAAGAGQKLRLRSDLALGIEETRVRGRHVLQAGDTAYCALSWAEELEAPTSADEAQGKIDATRRFWRAWLGRARLPDHRFCDPVQRSALAIKGLTYMPTGATVAALTTSLPETPGGRVELGLPLQVDPRHDFHAAGAALPQPRLGGGRVMQFVADIEPTEDGSLEIMYGIDGRRDLTESTRDDLSGYRARSRSGSATARSISARTTSSARCSTRF
jgi:alpha,alpha-trehalase